MKGDHVGEFEELVLLAVRGLAADAYGVSVARMLSQETAREVSIGAVYAALDRLETKGLVRSAMTEGQATRGGRSRRSFAITPEGSAALKEMSRVRERLWNAVSARGARGRA